MQAKKKDPVCGMDVEGASPRHEKFNDTDYYFCSDACMEKFRTSPSTYAPGGPR